MMGAILKFLIAGGAFLTFIYCFFFYQLLPDRADGGRHRIFSGHCCWFHVFAYFSLGIRMVRYRLVGANTSHKEQGGGSRCIN